ncbi:MAG TPA: RING finger protein, partial [Solirubrobacteraceae bacterium]
MPPSREATAGDAGRSCPYCRFPLKEGAQVRDCPTCGAAHHDDCWSDNGGCSVVGCAGGPDAPGAGRPPAGA